MHFVELIYLNFTNIFRSQTFLFSLKPCRRIIKSALRRQSEIAYRRPAIFRIIYADIRAIICITKIATIHVISVELLKLKNVSVSHSGYYFTKCRYLLINNLILQ